MIKIKMIFCVAAIVLYCGGNAFAQKKKCMLIGAAPGEEHGQADGPDADMKKWLEKWGYVVDKKTSTDVPNLTEADFKAYNFMFISETVLSDKIAPLKHIPLPMLNSDGYAVKELSFNWAPGTPAGIHEPGVPITILEEAKGHQLAAGYEPGVPLEVGYLATKSDCLTNWGIPTINVIPIASVQSNPEELVIYGIEKGTKNVSGEVMQNRVALVGIHCWCYNNLKEPGIKLFKAAINWVLEEDGGAIEDKITVNKSFIKLLVKHPGSSYSITYFNPEYSKVNLTVWNKTGQKVQALVNGLQTAGVHTVQLKASDIPSGVYFFILKTGNVNLIQKIPLVL
jgi:hypothetical protein